MPPRLDMTPNGFRSTSSHHPSEIKEAIISVEKEIETYTSEMMALQSRMLFLLSQCDRLEQRKLSLQSLSSLVHRLPNEIVTKIFTFTCVENNLQCAKVTPLIIAATCARWRELAVSCPKLWSCFDIHLRRENYPPQASARLDIFLQRSKNHCLTLFITYYNRLPLDSNNYFLQQLLQHSDRWQHVTFNVTRFSFENFPGLRAAVLPRLETVKLTHEDINTEDNLELDILRSCSLRTIHTRSSLPYVGGPPFGWITDLAFTPHPEAMFEPLTRFPNIQYLGVRHDNESKYRSADVILRVVPITSIKVEFHPEVTRPLGPYQPDLLEVAMDSLIAPSLTELVIQVDDHTHENAANSRISLPRTFLCVSHFIVRSCCTLSVLVLQGLPVSDKLVVDLLKDLRGLTDLTIEDPDRMMLQQQSYPISEDLIESLHVCRPNYLNPSPNPLVPNLRSLVLKVRSQEPFNAVTFNLTIASRWIPDKEYETQSNVSCLRSVELHLPDKVDRTLYFLLISLERCGMRIVVKEESYT